MKRGAILMNLVHSLLLHVRVKLRLQIMYEEHGHVGLLPVEYEQGGEGAEEFEEV